MIRNKEIQVYDGFDVEIEIIDKLHDNEIKEWLKNNLEASYKIVLYDANKTTFQFYTNSDAIKFKLTWR